MSASQFSWMVILVVSLGCSPKTPVVESVSQPGPSADAGVTSADPAMPDAGTLSSPPAPDVGVPGGLGLPGLSAPADAARSEPDPGTEQVKAEAGVGVKGQSLEGESGLLVVPAQAFFRVEQRVVFQIQIPEAMKLFKATEGRFPESEQEFMTKIIAANNINLPKLPAGHRYIYDPQAGELKVERPRK